MNAFVKKSISLPVCYDQPPRLISSKELAEVRSFNAYVDCAKAELATLHEQKKQEIEDQKAHEMANLAAVNANKFLAEMEAFHNLKNHYFSLLESHCGCVVKHALNSILSDLPDEQKIASSLALALKTVKNESKVELRVHPQNDIPTNAVAAQQNWTCVLDSNVAVDECHLDLNLGQYVSGFKSNMAILKSCISK